jgi:transcriptional regulator with PAS, ATPase and Fis domain
LQNLIEQAMNVKSYGVLDMDCFDDCFDTTRMRSIVKGTLKEQLQKQEKIVIIETYKRHNKNKRKTAEELGVSRPLLYQRLKEYGMD